MWEDHVRYGITVEEWQARRRRRLLDAALVVTRLASARRRCGEWPAAFALRTVVRRFHIFIFQ